jgi:L-lactate dehydrogenase complex protein LldE
MRVALFATCLVDLLRPSVGFATVKLLQQADCEVIVPPTQTCCGQPAYNNGDKQTALQLAKLVVDTFEIYDYVVIPSGSCGGMLKVHYPELLKDEPDYYIRARELAARCYELTSFLVDVLKHESFDASYHGRLTYHDSCSSLRELGIKQQPRRLLNNISGCQLNEMDGRENCCGFGGTFCVKYPAISTRMVDDKVNHIYKSGADTLVAADLGCLLNIAGRIKHLGLPTKIFHVAEVLAGMAEGPGMGEDESK